MSKYLPLPRGIDIIRGKLGDPLFDFDSLRKLINNGELGLLLKLDNPSVLFLESKNPDDWGEPEHNIYKLKGCVLATPIKPFDFGELVPEEIQFNWKNTIYKLWGCSNKHWVIKETDLDDFFNLPPKEPDWNSLSTGTVAMNLMEIWEFRWKNVKKDIPNVKLLLRTVRHNPDKFQNYSASENLLIHDSENKEGWGLSKLDQSWKGIIKNYTHLK